MQRQMLFALKGNEFWQNQQAITVIAYKWVDWETRLCDWETQKQVCLYAERLPSFLLLR